MLQLATLSARGASEARDLLITPGCRAAPAPSSTLHRSCFRPAWRSPLQFAISTIGNSAGLIGAGYMIVNELALTRAGCGANPHPRWPCGPHPSSSRSPTRARGILVSPRLEVRRERCTAILCERHTAECQEGISRDTSGLDGRHKIISRWARSSRCQRDKTRTHGSLTPRHRQRVQGRPQTSNFP